MRLLLLKPGPTLPACRRDMQVQCCRMLSDTIDHALKRASDLQPLKAMLQPIMSALIQCFQQEDAHVKAAQPSSGQSAQLTAVAGVINLITLQVPA